MLMERWRLRFGQRRCGKDCQSMDVEGRDHFPLCEYLKLHAEQGLEAYPYQIPAKQADQHPKNAEVE